MHKQIIVTMAVRDLDKSRAFFRALGYAFEPMFSNEDAALMVISEGSINAMLMTAPFFSSFHTRKIANTQEAVEMWLCLSCESREEVDRLVAKAVALGATATGEPEDHGFMYGHGFTDLDGHAWQFTHMGGTPAQ